MSAWTRIIIALTYLTALLSYPTAPAVVSAETNPPVIIKDSSEGFSCSAISEIPLEECIALVSFFKQTGGYSWLRNDNWLESTLPSEWYGVLVHNGHVVGLHLKDNGLSGRIPADVDRLTALHLVELDGNELQGELPARLQFMGGMKPSALPSTPPLEYPGFEQSPTPQPTQELAAPRPEPEALQPNPPLPGVDHPQPTVTPLAYVEVGGSGWIATDIDAALEDGKTSPLSPEEASQRTADQVKAFDCVTVTDIPSVECQALVAIYNNANGAGWYTSTNWLASTTAANWYGITVNSGHVDSIQMVNNHLVGTIPVEIGNLPNLRFFILPQNQLSGSIPHEIGNLHLLFQLTLHTNQLSGSIPAEIGQCTALWSITLGGNNLIGSLPAQIGNLTALVDFQIQYNEISGSLPAQMGSMSSLQHFFAEYNQISGNVPTEIGNLTSLKNFWIQHNQLSGLVPESFTSLTNLCIPDGSDPYCYGLDLGYNQLTINGLSQPLLNFLTLHDPDWTITQISPFNSCVDVISIPLTECNALVALYNSTGGDNWINHTNWLANNQPGTWFGVTVSSGHVVSLGFFNNNLIGFIPTQIGDLNNLSILDLFANQLSGVIPTELGNLIHLKLLWLSYNQLTGSIPDLSGLVELQTIGMTGNQITGSLPAWLGSLINIRHIRLDGNQLSGEIPFEIGNITELLTLVLRSNNFSGSLPTSLGNLINLHELYLDYNQFSGEVPNLVAMGNLEWVTLNDNSFTGSLPSEWGQITTLEHLNVSNNLLTGSIPSEYGNLASLVRLNLSHNKLSGFIPESFTNLVNLCLPTGEYPCYDQYGLDLGYNQLTTSGYSQTLVDFLANKDPDWADTQWTPFTSCSTVTQIPVAECNALVAFYNATSGATWTSDENWLSSGTISSWYGVTVTDGHVTDLDLVNNNLTGPLTSEIASLNYLTTLALGYNPDMGGTIPAWLGNMTSLEYLDLFYTGLSGSIPTEIGNLNNLTHLLLSWNSFPGSIPAFLGNLTNLYQLDLSWSQMSGPIPAELGNLVNLELLSLQNNQLTGSLPAQMASMASLREVSLENNQLSGPLPTWLGTLTDLQQIFIGHNQFSGSIPTEIGNLTGLLRLMLSNNQLSGTVPSSLTNLVNLCLPDGNWPCWDQYGLDLGYNYLTTPATPQALSDFLALHDPDWANTQMRPFTSCADVTTIPVVECNALVDLYNATGGPNWRDNTNWLENNQPGTWAGVYVSDGQVNRLFLGYNYLNGTLPLSMGNLTSLVELSLYYNGFSGPIPSWISNLTQLEFLDLSSNQFSGSIPAWLGTMTHLKYLWLGYNNLVGPAPVELGNLGNLMYLDLSYSQLSGPLPSWIPNLTNLQNLALYDNQFTGSIPSWFGSMPNLSYLGLSNNLLTGNIPSELANSTSLFAIYVGSNQLTGSIPPVLGNLANLSELDLSRNQLSGVIPDLIGGLSNLRLLGLGHNQLSGVVPASFTNLVNLCTPTMQYCYDYGLDLSYNLLTTPATPQSLADFLATKDPDWQETQWIPFTSCLEVTQIPVSECDALTTLYNSTGGSGWTNSEYWFNSGRPAMWYGVTVSEGHVTDISLYSNNLTGAFPANLDDLSKLQIVNLGRNQLTGLIPPELGNLANLQALYLYRNQLTGEIPPELGNLTNLEGLALGQNELNGEIPSELSNLTKLSFLTLDQNQLTGSIPTDLGNLTNLNGLYLNNNQLSGEVPASFTNLINLYDPSFPDFQYTSYGLDLNFNRLTVPASPQDLADFLTLKNPGWEQTQAVSETIGTSGGEITSNDGDTSLSFPAGSLPGSMTITFVPQPAPSSFTGTLGFGNSSFLVEVATGTKFDFALPVTVNLTYADADLGALPWLLAENNLKLYWWNGTGWVDAVTTCATPSGYIRDTSANTLQLSICKSGEFALLGTYQPMLFLPVVKR